MAYAELEPFGPRMDLWRSASIAATIANVNRDPKKRTKPFQPEDFMPEEPLTDRERSERLQAKFSAAMMAFGGRTRRPDDPPKGTRRTPAPPVRAIKGGRRQGMTREQVEAPAPGRRHGP